MMRFCRCRAAAVRRAPVSRSVPIIFHARRTSNPAPLCPECNEFPVNVVLPFLKRFYFCVPAGKRYRHFKARYRAPKVLKATIIGLHNLKAWLISFGELSRRTVSFFAQ